MQERRRTVAIATETAGKREGLSAGKHEGAVRLSVVHGRRTFTEKGRNGRFSLMKSVKKYQIVGNNQNALSKVRILRAIERLRNSGHKSCKKELIPWVDYVIVSINLKNTSTSAPVRMYGTAARPGGWNCRIR